jgi:hypothetical protein
VPFDTETEIRIGLLLERYGVFYDGYRPSPYLDVDFDPEPWQREAPRCDEEDRKSLRLLFKHIGQEVEESWSLPDVPVHIENLIEVLS